MTEKEGGRQKADKRVSEQCEEAWGRVGQKRKAEGTEGKEQQQTGGGGLSAKRSQIYE